MLTFCFVPWLRRSAWGTLILLGSTLSILACSGTGQEPTVLDDTMSVRGPYLGQTAPGLSPVRFGPTQFHADQSWFWHGGPSFSPSGLEMFFSRYDVARDRMELYGASGIDGAWTLPAPAPFSLGIEANQPTWSSTGDTLFYVDNDALFRVTRTDGEWSSPSQVSLPLPTSHSLGWDFSMTDSGSLYVVLWNDGEPKIFRAALVNGSYEVPEPVEVGGSISLAGLGPVVAPDESYLIFASNRQGGYGMHDLWMCFRSVDGGWSEPINMGPSINSSSEDGGATLTPDGENLFFTTQRAGDSGYNPYWVSAALIDSLRAQGGF